MPDTRYRTGASASMRVSTMTSSGFGEKLHTFRDPFGCESGKRSDRPELAKALAPARKGKVTLLIAKLVRLARNVAFVVNLMDAGVDFVARDQPFASPS